MKLDERRSPCAVLFFVLISFQFAVSQVRLPRLISDGMVLQRDSDVKIWGWAGDGEQITVDFNGKTYTVTAEADGQWAVRLGEMSAGGPYTMEICAENHITLNDIMIGDVWVCSGQSNMELPMERVKYRYPDVIAQSDNPAIRQFFVPRVYDFKKPQGDFPSGSWEPANPKTVLKFTAAGYFFAKELYEKHHVPIGLINAGLGGSPAQAWMSEDALKAFPDYLETAKKFRDEVYLNAIVEKDEAASNAWYTQLSQRDKGLAEEWFTPGYDASDWATMKIPGYWTDRGLGRVTGVVWFRKEIDVPASMTNKPAKLWLGRIVDADQTYINGKRVGEITYEWPPRIYDIASDLLTPGKNIIVVRLINNSSGRGGFVPEKSYKLTAAGQTIDLTGQWQYKVGAATEPLLPKTFIQWQPMGLYNAMIAPLLNCRIKGVIWYQGESNTSKPGEYQRLFSAMITNWRDKWGQSDFPFLYVQLANFMEAKDEPSESNWAELREAQLQTLTVPNTGMVVTIDIGEGNDIHPLNKEDVGKRLARAAGKIAYGEKDIVCSGPLYESMRIDGNKVILSFTHIGGGLVAEGGKLQSFAIAGPDKKFVWAKAQIDDDHVVVWNEAVDMPTAVRYAWADNPEGANLYNKEGLPASPFRTDR